jgi:hypothetical protein
MFKAVTLVALLALATSGCTFEYNMGDLFPAADESSEQDGKDCPHCSRRNGNGG